MWQAERDDNGVRVEFSATLANIDASAKAVEEFLKSSAYRGSAFVVLLLLARLVHLVGFL